jgi:two-component system response regulator NreC
VARYFLHRHSAVHSSVPAGTNNQIAERLIISPKTVDTHRTHIMDKLNLHSRAELVKYAMRRGLLED